MNETSMLPQCSQRSNSSLSILARAGVLTTLSLMLSITLLGTHFAYAADQQRKDNVFGTVDEGISSGTNPHTGDNEIRIESTPPPEEQNNGYQLGDQPIIIQPEIKIKPKK